MAKKAKKASKSAAKKTQPARKSKPAAKKKSGKAVKPAAAASETPAAPKALKPLTMKQRLALIRVDPTTGRCPHGLAPETCSFCMSI